MSNKWRCLIFLLFLPCFSQGWRERDTIVTAITGLVEEVNKQIRSELLPENKVTDNQENQVKVDAKLDDPSLIDDVEAELLRDSNDDDRSKGSVKVLGMEMTESCEKGAKWSRPQTPLSRPATPQNIYITGPLAPASKLLVSDEHIETLTDDNAVVLTGKVTLSLIGLNQTEERNNSEPTDDGAKDVECMECENNLLTHDDPEKPKGGEGDSGEDEDDSAEDEFESDIEESPTPN